MGLGNVAPAPCRRTSLISLRSCARESRPAQVVVTRVITARMGPVRDAVFWSILLLSLRRDDLAFSASTVLPSSPPVNFARHLFAMPIAKTCTRFPRSCFLLRVPCQGPVVAPTRFTCPSSQPSCFQRPGHRSRNLDTSSQLPFRIFDAPL